MTKYTVIGGTPLRGKVELKGAKNVGFKVMIASLLGNSPSTLKNLGLISEIGFATQIITSLGGNVTALKDPHSISIDPGGLSKFEIPSDMSRKSRFSIMYVGPLLSKFGRVVFPQPGGDKIGKRPIDRHIQGLEALGVKFQFKDGFFEAFAPDGLHGQNYHFHKNSHNGTEVLILAAVKAKGTTILENAAAEPEVDDLIKFLNNMGANIIRITPRTIKIEGVESLEGTTHEVMMDRNEAVTFACMALGTNGEIFIKGADPKVLDAFLQAVNQANGGFEINDGGIGFFKKGALFPTQVTTSPYPGFMTDWQPIWTTLMTQAQGTSTVHETVYESRFDYVPELIKMGAKIKSFSPSVEDPENVYNFNLEDDSPDAKHAIEISGPSHLFGAQLEVNDIRSGATALFAGMISHGVSIILDSNDQIKRGYEDLADRLSSLGAKIDLIE